MIHKEAMTALVGRECQCWGFIHIVRRGQTRRQRGRCTFLSGGSLDVHELGPRAPITNRQKFVALSSVVKELSLKVTGIKSPQTSDDSLFAPRAE